MAQQDELKEGATAGGASEFEAMFEESLRTVNKTLGLPISATIVSNGPKAVISSNEGRPIVLKFPREKMSDDLHAVARLVSHPEPVASGATTERTKRAWWTRFGTRTSEA